MRRGLSVLEVALAFVILGVAIVPILNLFFGTSRLQRATSSHFREAVAGQLIWEAIKAQNMINPMFLRDLGSSTGFEQRDVPHPHRPAVTVPGLVHTGAFVATNGPIDVQGQPLAVSPLATYLLNRSGGVLYAPDNQISLDANGPTATVTVEEIASLTRNYQDLAVRITVVDGLLPDWGPNDPPSKPLVRNELLKDVFIEVFHLDGNRRLLAKPTFRMEAALETPSASLTAAGVRKLREDTEDYSYKKEVAAAIQGVRRGMPSSLMGGGMFRVAADMVLVAIESVGESMLSQGFDLGFRLPNGDTMKGSDHYADELKGLDSPVAKITAAELRAEEAKGIFRAFRRSIRSIEALNKYGDWYAARLVPVVRAFSRNLRTYENTTDPDVKQRAKLRVQALANSYRKTLTQLGFWTRVLSEEKWYKALGRPLFYVNRYRTVLDSAQRLYRLAEAHPLATPMDKVRALSGYLEIAKARKLFESSRRLDEEEQYLRTRAELLAPQMRPFADALKNDELFDYDVLAHRNEKFHETMKAMHRLLGTNGDYKRTMDLLRPSGRMQGYRRRMNEVFDKFNLPEFNGELNQEIGDLVAQVEDADFPDADEPENVTGGSNDGLPTDGDETDDPPE